ncbi:MAG: BamA/TamA family outer membrane protein [Nostocaceae cyanobacterium]|nr:BamA/TamA family outer membrane protein [Nostocaceae cyanobacterium]
MRLSPVFLAVVAIASPLAGIMVAKGETVDTSALEIEPINGAENPVDVSPQVKQENKVVVARLADQLEAEAQPEIIVPTEIHVPTTTTTFSTAQPKQPEAVVVPQVVVPIDTNKTPEKTQDLELSTDAINPGTENSGLVRANPEPAESVVLPEVSETKNTSNQTEITPDSLTAQGAAPLLRPKPKQTTPSNQPPVNQQPAPNAPEPETIPGNNSDQPAEQPEPPATPENAEPRTPSAADEARVLVSEVVVRTTTTAPLPKELEDEVYRVIRTQAGRTTTRSQLQEDINAIFTTGFFSDVRAEPEDTPLGVRVSFIVQPNPILRKVQVDANPGTGVPSVLPATIAEEVFKEQYGKILNLRELNQGIQELNKRYRDQGYVLAQVIGSPQVAADGTVVLRVAEGVVEDIRVRYRTKEGQEQDAQGNPIRGRTQDYIVKRELQSKPGTVFNRNTVQKDLQRVFGLGLFEDVNVSLDPGSDPSKVDVVVNLVERSSGSIGATGGISSASGLFAGISYQQQNLNGRNQKLGAEFQVGQRELLFDLRFTDPWIAGDPYRTSYTVNAFRRRSISLIFDGEDRNIETVNPNNPTEEGDRPRVLRLGGGVTFTRPLSKDVFQPAEWTALAGVQYQRVSIRDADGNLRSLGQVPNEPPIDLSFSGEGKDDLLTVQLGAVRDLRNNPLQPTDGSFLRVGVDQSLPVGLGNIFLTRLRGTYTQFFPVKFTNFAKGPQALAVSLQAGTVLGDLPPYEAFSLGGTNSVRGYDEGALGSGRSFVQATAEYRFPVFSVISGVLFLDVGSDFGTGKDVPGNPARLLDKPGSGYGYGIGIRIQSPLGPIRLDYGLNDEGGNRIHFGIGERF